MRNFSATIGLATVVALTCSALANSSEPAFAPLPFESEVQHLKLPEGWYLGEVAGLEVDADGDIYIFNRGTHSLLKFDSNGEFIREIGAGLFKTPHGLRVDDAGNIWTADQETHQVLRFTQSGEISLILGRRFGAGTEWYADGYTVALLNEPSDVAFDSEGNIYVADAGNFRVVKYDRNGEPLTKWGVKGNKPGEFDFPHSIAVDQDDRIYVTDRQNGRVQIFSAEGVFLNEWTGFGHPYEIQFRPDGTFWLTDARAGRILHLDSNGHVLGSFGQWGKEIGDLGFPHGFDFTPDGSLLVGEILNWRVQRLTPRN